MRHWESAQAALQRRPAVRRLSPQTSRRGRTSHPDVQKIERNSLALTTFQCAAEDNCALQRTKYFPLRFSCEDSISVSACTVGRPHDDLSQGYCDWGRSCCPASEDVPRTRRAVQIAGLNDASASLTVGASAIRLLQATSAERPRHQLRGGGPLGLWLRARQ
jgi:hypothetical protein